MQTIVQYSPQHPEAIDILRKKWFLYNLDPGSEWVTSFNRVRKLADKFHVVGITKNLILALLVNSWGFPLDRGVNTGDAQITSFCYINVDRFKRAVFVAILAWQLQARSPQLFISDELVHLWNEKKWKQRRKKDPQPYLDQINLGNQCQLSLAFESEIS